MAEKFKLQSVLNYRQSLEDQAQQALTACLQMKSELETQLRQQADLLKKYDGELQFKQQQGMTISEMNLFESHITHCRHLIRDIHQKIDDIDLNIIEKRTLLQKAARDRQIMEKLKEKQDAEYHKELSRKEMAMLDEISLRTRGERS